MGSPFEPDLEKARRFLQAHAPPGAFLAGVTGAHAYGFPSRDSDLDLKGFHVAPTAQIVALDPPPDGVEYLGEFEALEVDYTSHELAFALRLLLKGNGNMLERIATPFHAIESPGREELASLADAFLSVRFHHHYRGFFETVRELARTEGTAKRYLYAYRSALTGIHLLATGECILDVGLMAREHAFPRVEELIVMKREDGEKAPVRGETASYEEDFRRLDAMLEYGSTRSALPAQPTGAAALSDFLVRQRRAAF